MFKLGDKVYKKGRPSMKGIIVDCMLYRGSKAFIVRWENEQKNCYMAASLCRAASQKKKNLPDWWCFSSEKIDV